MGVLGDEIAEAIYAEMVAHDLSRGRSMQTAPGPSEIGHPCDRRLAFMAAQIPKVNTKQDRWPLILGTAFHALVAEALAASPRFIVEKRVRISDPTEWADGIYGSCDVYDRATSTVADHKLVGDTLRREAEKGEPKLKYRKQLAMYAKGWRNEGLPVDNVCIIHWPKASGLSTRVAWDAPYDEVEADAAISRWQGIATAVHHLAVRENPRRIEEFAKDTGDCFGCPWYSATLAIKSPGLACSGKDKGTVGRFNRI